MSKIEKQRLFDKWTFTHTENCVQLFDKHIEFNKSNAIQRIMVFANISENSIYVLIAKIQGIDIPIYVGKSKDPFARWKQHILGIESGKASYAKWRRLLLDDNDTFNFDVKLVVVPETKVLFPPILGFPVTIGAIEYQLVSLISDAYPDTLLNSEGNRR